MVPSVSNTPPLHLEGIFPEHLSVQECRVPSRGAQIWARMCGAAEADAVLLVIHGGPGLSCEYLLGLEQLAGEHLAVIHYDQRGCGRSTGEVTYYSDFSLSGYVEDLEAVRAALAGRPVHILGHSWGGLVAMTYTLAHPDQVLSLLLVGSVPPTMRALLEGGTRMDQRVAALQAVGWIPAVLTADPVAREQQLLPAYFADVQHPVPGDFRDFRRSVLERTIANLVDYDLTAELASLTQPVLLMFGTEDPFGLEWVQETRTALTRARVEVTLIEDCGHYYWLECPDRFFDRVRAFLKV